MRLLPLVVAALSMSGVAAYADPVTYTLINSPSFTTVTGAYTTSDKITGSFTLTNPIPPSETGQSATPASYSFSDGLNAYTNQNSSIISFDSLGTDASGNTNQFEIGIASNTTLASFAL